MEGLQEANLKCQLLLVEELSPFKLVVYPRFDIPGGGYTVLALILALSFRLSITNIFCLTFLSNHASQPLET